MQKHISRYKACISSDLILIVELSDYKDWLYATEL